MKVALITDEPYYTGIGKYSENLFLQLRRMKVDVDLYFVKWSSHEVEVRTEGCAVVRPLPFGVPVKTLEALIAHWRRDSLFPADYDVYHVAQQFLVSVLPKRGSRIATIHDLKPLVLPRDYPFLLRRSLAHFAGESKDISMVLTDSRSTKKDVERLLSVPEEKVRTVYLGKSDAFRPRGQRRAELGLPEKSRILINVGNDDASKNMPFLMQVVKRLSARFENIFLLRVGSRLGKTVELANSLGLKGRVKCVSGLTDEELSLHYSSSDLLLHPSRYEGFGLPPLEAMASGCPAVCSDISSLPEVVGDAGLTIPLDLGRWTDTISDLLEHGDALAKLQKKGVERAAGFTWERCANETMKAYAEAAR